MGQETLTVWITRAEPGAAATARRVMEQGWRPVVSPLLEIRPLPDVHVDLDGVAALAFTSANGVRAFADICPVRDIRVFAVGSGTAEAAKAAGFRQVLFADGDVESLAARIAARRSELRGAVLNPGAAEPAGDLVGALESSGIAARRVVLYEAVVTSPTKEFLERLPELDVVLLHSPRAAKALATALRGRDVSHLRLVCLSANVAKPVSRMKVRDVVRAPFPIEAALLNLVGRGPSVPPPTRRRQGTQKQRS